MESTTYSSGFVVSLAAPHLLQHSKKQKRNPGIRNNSHEPTVSVHTIPKATLSFCDISGFQTEQGVEGLLVKRKQDSGLRLFSNWTKRYFILDHEACTFSYTDCKGRPNKVVIPFNRIKDVRLSSPIMVKPAGFKHDFTLVTTDRLFYLFAKTLEIKKMWLRSLLNVKAQQQKCELISKLEKEGYKDQASQLELQTNADVQVGRHCSADSYSDCILNFKPDNVAACQRFPQQNAVRTQASPNRNRPKASTLYAPSNPPFEDPNLNRITLFSAKFHGHIPVVAQSQKGRKSCSIASSQNESPSLSPALDRGADGFDSSNFGSFLTQEKQNIEVQQERFYVKPNKKVIKVVKTHKKASPKPPSGRDSKTSSRYRHQDMDQGEINSTVKILYDQKKHLQEDTNKNNKKSSQHKYNSSAIFDTQERLKIKMV